MKENHGISATYRCPVRIVFIVCIHTFDCVFFKLIFPCWHIEASLDVVICALTYVTIVTQRLTASVFPLSYLVNNLIIEMRFKSHHTYRPLVLITIFLRSFLTLSGS